MTIHLGAFRLGERLGSGGTGTVYKAVHLPTGVAAAVKVVRIGPDHRPVRHNLDAEVRAVVALDHPNIVSIYDVGEVDEATALRSDGKLVAGTPWYAMELAEDGSLRQRIRTMDWTDLSRILAQLLDALAHSHARGVLHLDLKPDNVLFTHGRPAPKLTDYGMGVVGPLDPDEDFVRGTPDYMAPEQVRGRWDEIGPWTDLYALGCLAWRCATGEAPFSRKTPTEVLEAHVFAELPAFEARFDVPDGLGAWLLRLVHKDPEQRFRFAIDAANALAALDDRPVPGGFPEDWRVPERQAAAEVLSVTGLGLAAVRDPPLVGRTRERTQLWGALRRAHAGEARVVVLRGPEGTGKSRLARWIGVRAHELGLAVVTSASGTARSRVPALVGALRGLFPVEIRSREAEGELGARLQARGMSAPAARDAAALLVYGLDADSPTGQSWSEAIRDLLVAASDRPAILVLDDIHQGAVSLQALIALLRAGCPPAVWVVVAGDDALMEHPVEEDLVRQLAALPCAETIALGPLSRQASAALSRRLLAFDPTVSAQIAARGGGSPLAQVQLVHDLAQRQALEPGPDGFRLRPGTELASLATDDPVWTDRLRELVRVRGYQQALEIAAILGPTIDEREWSAAARALGLQLPEGIVDELFENRLIRSATPDIHGARFSFVHPNLRETLAADAAGAGRATDVHRACGAVVDAADPERKGLHLWRGGSAREALPFLRRALDAARYGEVGRYAQLLTLADQVAKEAGAAAEGFTPALEQHRLTLAVTLGRTDEAQQAAEHLRAAATDPHWTGVAELALARLALERGDDPEPFLAHAEHLAATDDAVLACDALVLGVYAACARGDEALAANRCQRAAALAVPPSRGLDVQLASALLALRAGKMDDALARVASAAATAETVAPRSWWSAALPALAGDCALVAGDAVRAAELYRTARRRHRALGHNDEVMAHLGLVAALFLGGRAERAQDALERVRARVLLPRQRIRAQVIETALRAARPSDPAFPRLWRATEEELQRGLARLDPILAPVLARAAEETPRPERARTLREAALAL